MNENISRSYFNLEEIIKKESSKKNTETLDIINETKATITVQSEKIKAMLLKLGMSEKEENL